MVIKFYNGNILETTINVDYKTQAIQIENHTDDIIHLAFGVNTNPTWEDFEDFLEDRCPPRSRQNIKEILQHLGVQSYDPIAIIEKTEGRMAEDKSWMELDWERD